MYNKVVEENRKNDSVEKDINNSFSKEHIQKINSAKNIKS